MTSKNSAPSARASLLRVDALKPPATNPGVFYVHLTRGKVAIVDESSRDAIRGLSWYAHSSGAGYFYAAARMDGKLVLMHRFLMRPAGAEVDHINGDTLDNRRANLRLCTRAENARNRRLSRNNTSGFKGVTRDRGRWSAAIYVNSKKINLGAFGTPSEAAAAYQRAAAEYHGEFVRAD